MRAVFFGTPQIAVPSLEALHEIAEVLAVVCQPDRPAGRGLALREPAIKTAAKEAGLEVFQPTKLKKPEFASWLASLEPDVALVMAYGRILSQRVLDVPRRGCMNLHASILPKYRGAAPINWAIVNGETETGVCLMQMDAGMDTGPVYTCHRTPIGPSETAGALAERLGNLAADVVRADFRRAVAEELSAHPQDDAMATRAPLLEKGDGTIRWSASAQQVHDHVRGMTPWPGAVTTLDGRRLKILTARVHSDESLDPPGLVLVADPSALVMACGTGTLEIERLQLEGRKPVSAREAVCGRCVKRGDVLGSKEA